MNCMFHLRIKGNHTAEMESNERRHTHTQHTAHNSIHTRKIYISKLVFKLAAAHQPSTSSAHHNQTIPIFTLYENDLFRFGWVDDRQPSLHALLRSKIVRFLVSRVQSDGNRKEKHTNDCDKKVVIFI